MHRIIVDLPDPDGPQTTTFSLVLTVKLMSCSTWTVPNHLSTEVNSMHTSAFKPLRATGDVSTTSILRLWFSHLPIWTGVSANPPLGFPCGARNLRPSVCSFILFR